MYKCTGFPKIINTSKGLQGFFLHDAYVGGGLQRHQEPGSSDGGNERGGRGILRKFYIRMMAGSWALAFQRLAWRPFGLPIYAVPLLAEATPKSVYMKHGRTKSANAV